MTQEKCVYATVFNNVSTLEDSIKSVWRPNYTIVITDNYSWDGTWEKLQELRKEYNLILYRLKSTRGKGRDYSLKHCPDNSLTAYFDLDCLYNENFHKILDLEIPEIFIYGPQFSYIGKKGKIIELGGWKNYNVAEDIEFLSRMPFRLTFPIIIARNQHVEGKVEYMIRRERRYSNSTIHFYIRMFKNLVDYIRASNYSYVDFIEIKPHISAMKKFLAIFPYLIATILGKEKNGAIDNFMLMHKKALETLSDIKKYYNAENKYIGFAYDKNFIEILEKKTKINVLNFIQNKLSLKIFVKGNLYFFTISEEYINEWYSSI